MFGRNKNEYNKNEAKLENTDETKWAENIIKNSNNSVGLSMGYEKLLEIPSLKKKIILPEVLNKLSTLRFISEAEYDIEGAKQVESFAKEKGIDINFGEAFQETYLRLFNKGRINEILELERYAGEKNISFKIPSIELFQDVFNSQLISPGHEWLNGAGERAKEIEEYAKKNGIRVEVDESLQRAFNGLLVTGDVRQAKEAEVYAKEKGVTLNFDKIQECRDKLLEKGSLYYAIKLEEYATEKGIVLHNPEKEVLQKIYVNTLAKGGYEFIENIQKIENYASEKGYKLLKAPQDTLQQGIENRLVGGSYKSEEDVEGALRYAKINDIVINIEEIFQHAYIIKQSSNYFSLIQDFESFASRKGIKLNEINKEILQKNLQWGFEYDLAKGRVFDAERMRQFAKDKGVELKLTDDTPQIIEESYIRLLHNNQEGHADYNRKALTEEAEINGFNLDYNKCIKIDYLDFLKVPENERLVKKQNISVGNILVKAEFYGQIKNTEIERNSIEKNNICKGKFILAENKTTKELKLIFDSTMGEHRDIGAKYEVNVIGGGWMEINTDNKKIEVDNESQSFGFEPRIITAKVVGDCFPEYTISCK